MAITDQEFVQAEERMAALRQAGYAVAARYDQSAGRVVVTLNTEVEISFPARSAEGLAHASPDDLNAIEISPSGLSLHWPKLDADLYVPGLMAGQLGSRRWMAQTLGAVGGAARSEVKAAAARENGKKGGRPAKAVPGTPMPVPTEQQLVAKLASKVLGEPASAATPRKTEGLGPEPGQSNRTKRIDG